MRLDQVLTLFAFLAVAVIALILDKNIGFVAITAAVALSFLGPKRYQDTVKQIAWPTVLLVAGVSCYATILTEAGSPEFVGDWAAGLGVAAIGALVLCYVGGVVSAFASSTALLPVIIPIAVPLVADGGISAAFFVAALAVSSTIVDVSPFSTNGALMLANRPDSISEPVYYRQILTYSVRRGRRRAAAGVGRAGAAGLVTGQPLRHAPRDPGHQNGAGRGLALGQDGADVVVDGVLGEHQGPGHGAGVGAGGEVGEHLALARAEAVGQGEHLAALGDRADLDGDRDLDGAGHPLRAQRDPPARAEMHP